MTTLAASGMGRHTWSTVDEGVRRWNTADFEVTKEELRDLATLLDETHFVMQPRATIAPDVHDGATWIVHLRTGAREKYVKLSNAFPEPLMRLGRFVIDLVNRRDLRDKRRAFASSGLHDRHLWRGMAAYEGRTDPYPVWLCVVPEATRPFAVGTSVRGRLLDRTRKAVGTMANRTTPEQPDACLAVRPRDIDASRDYAFEVEITTPSGARTKLAPAVLTKGAPHVLVVRASE